MLLERWASRVLIRRRVYSVAGLTVFFGAVSLFGFSYWPLPIANGTDGEVGASIATSTTTTGMGTLSPLPSGACDLARLPILSEVPKEYRIDFQAISDAVIMRIGLPGESSPTADSPSVSIRTDPSPHIQHDTTNTTISTNNGTFSAVYGERGGVGVEGDRVHVARQIDWRDGDLFLSMVAFDVGVDELNGILSDLRIVSFTEFLHFQDAHTSGSSVCA